MVRVERRARRHSVPRGAQLDPETTRIVGTAVVIGEICAQVVGRAVCGRPELDMWTRDVDHRVRRRRGRLPPVEGGCGDAEGVRTGVRRVDRRSERLTALARDDDEGRIRGAIEAEELVRTLREVRTVRRLGDEGVRLDRIGRRRAGRGRGEQDDRQER